MYTRIMDNYREDNMENDMETGFSINRCLVQGPE